MKFKKLQKYIIIFENQFAIKKSDNAQGITLHRSEICSFEKKKACLNVTGRSMSRDKNSFEFQPITLNSCQCKKKWKSIRVHAVNIQSRVLDIRARLSARIFKSSNAPCQKYQCNRKSRLNAFRFAISLKISLKRTSARDQRSQDLTSTFWISSLNYLQKDKKEKENFRSV